MTDKEIARWYDIAVRYLNAGRPVADLTGNAREAYLNPVLADGSTLLRARLGPRHG